LEDSLDIAAGLAAASQAITIARAMRDIERSYDTVTLKAQTVDLMDKLIEVRGALQDARDDLATKDRMIDQLKQAAEIRAETVVVAGYRYSISSDDKRQPAGAPFCPRCDTVDGRMIRCTETERGRNAKCPQCKAEFPDALIYLWPGR
jgi:hypothetical protein